MVKRLFVIIFFICLLIYPGIVKGAESHFYTDEEIIYKVDESGITHVTNSITIENATSDKKATNYILDLQSVDPTEVSVRSGDQDLNFSKIKDQDKTKINIDLGDPVAGIGKQKNLILEYTENRLTRKTGEIWEISIPKPQDLNALRKYSVILIVNKQLGNASYIVPTPINSNEDSSAYSYIFNKESIRQSGISAGFGKFQAYSFQIQYHLENQQNRAEIQSIALPPDTSSQNIVYSSIDPLPDKIIRDDDGNWMAGYNLNPRQRMDITAKGTVQIFASPIRTRLYSEKYINDLTAPTEYWPTENPTIKEINKNLKTPEDIYKYVVNYLHYNVNKVKLDTKRSGAVEALIHPDDALCTEFTDLFITLSRSAGIPAREIDGYVYTENKDIQPVSLTADVLHTWPEFWDKENNQWIAVDPTWESATGVDYFHKLDLRHFSFVIHGMSDSYPVAPGAYKLGTNPQKDIFINFTQIQPQTGNDFKIDYTARKLINPFVKRYTFIVRNTGGQAIYNNTMFIQSDTKEIARYPIDILLPYSQAETTMDINFGFLSTKSPKLITILFAGKEGLIQTHKETILIYQLIIIFFIFIIILAFFLWRIGKFRLYSKLSGYHGKKDRRTTE